MTPDIAKALWYRALENEIGIAIEIMPEDRKRITVVLYTARQDAKDPELEKLIMVNPSKYPNDIWLVRKAVELD